MKKIIQYLPTVAFCTFSVIVIGLVTKSILENGAGLNSYIDVTGQFHPGKTFWDWLDLLIIPGALAIFAYTFDRNEKKREKTIEIDRMRENTLQQYFNDIERLTFRGLQTSKKGDSIREIARSRTLAVLRMLDGKRKWNVLKFLSDMNLILRDKDGTNDHPIISLHDADLSYLFFCPVIPSKDVDFRYQPLFQDIDLSGSDLNNAQLNEIKFYNANLNNANWTDSLINGCVFSGVSFTSSYFVNCKIRNSHFMESDFSSCKFIRAKIQETEFYSSIFYSSDWASREWPFYYYADFSNSALNKVVFFGGDILPMQLEKAKSLKNSILPIGFKFDGKYSFFDLKAVETPEYYESLQRPMSGFHKKLLAFCNCGNELECLSEGGDPINGFWWGLVKHRIYHHHHELKEYHSFGGRDMKVIVDAILERTRNKGETSI